MVDNVRMLTPQISYSQLPTEFYKEVRPTAEIEPSQIRFNEKLGNELGIDPALKGIDKKPIALVYAGHQFGHFVPQLGDGRAVLLGEVKDKQGKIFDLHLKGSGPTPFSRGGDGMSALGPVIREYIVSEFMHELGVPTTRALTATLTGGTVIREEELPGASMIRVASSHIRVGTFEFFKGREEEENIKVLADFAIGRHDPELLEMSESDRYFKFFENVVHRQLSLVSKWMGLGFIHGVMNTDNMTVSGETIDYGPCAFQDHLKLDKVYSSIDRHGRYAYNNQPNIAFWNLGNLAHCLSQLLDEGPVKQLMEEMPSIFHTYFLKDMGNKLGIFQPMDSDIELITWYLTHLEEEKKDFTNSFRNLPDHLWPELVERHKQQGRNKDEVRQLMDSVNPEVIPRNHQVEKAIEMSYEGDYSHFEKMLEIMKDPYSTDPSRSEFVRPPEPCEIVKATFCGT